MNKLLCGAAGLLFLAAAALLPAQYQLHVWNDFEAPGLPDNLKMEHYAAPENLRPVPYAQLPPRPGLTGGVAETENRGWGLMFTPSDSHRHLSVLNKTSLVRDQLMAQGRALFQADFYLPPEGEPIPNMAMVAWQYDPNSKYFFYRFGLQGNSLFFAYASGKSQPEIYLQQRVDQFGLSRPGWHRFQIIFVGSSEIYCAVDGKPTGFSPITEPSLRRLNVGIMMTTGENEEWVGQKVGFADNLSIQWTPYEADIPISPWVGGPVAIAGRTSSVGTRRELMEVGSAVNWTGDSGAAWREAQRANKPVLALFHVPRIPPYQYLVEICPDDESARAFLERFILLRIDINQLGGSTAARNFQIVRTPTMVVVGPDGRERSRVTVVRGQTSWQDIVNALGG